MVSWVRPETAEIPAKPVKGPVLGENPVTVTSAEIPMWGAPALLSNMMSPPSVHVGEQPAFNVGVIRTRYAEGGHGGAGRCPA